MRELVLRKITRSEANRYPDIIPLHSDEAVVLHRFTGNGRQAKGTIKVHTIGQEVLIECTRGGIFVAPRKSGYLKRLIEERQVYYAQFGDNINLGPNGVYQIQESL